MISDDKISIIIPAYNAAETLADAIESIMYQTFHPSEIIIVDDGSKDETFAIASLLASVHSNIKVVHQENGGVSAARQTGVMNSDGDWILFMDADDTLPRHALEYLKNGIQDNRFDIVLGDLTQDSYERILSSNEYCHQLLNNSIHVGPVGKLFRKTLFDKNTFTISKEIRMGEDLLMNIGLAFNNKKEIHHIGKKVYNYICNPKSISQTFQRTPEHEELFACLLRDRIPIDQLPQYQFSLLKNRINGWKLLNYLKWNVDQNRNSKFYNSLVSDIITTGYKPTLFEYIYIYSNNVLTLSIANLITIFSSIWRKWIKCK